MDPAGSNWNDNRFRAYWNTGTDFVDGFVRFDLSSSPDGATILSMTLRASHEYGFGHPYSSPEVRVSRVADDSWSRSHPADPHPGLDESLTGIYTGFPSADLGPVDFVLDVTAADWSVDLGGRHPNPAPPELIVECSSSTWTASGSCPGTMTFRTAGPTIAQLATSTFVTANVPAGACGRIRVQAVDVATCSVSNFIDL